MHTKEKVQIEYSKSPYLLTAPAVVAELESDVDSGLTITEASTRLAQHGENKLEGTSGVSLAGVLLRQATNALGLVLVLAMALSYAVKDYVEGGVITAVIILNIVVGVFQEYRAEQTIDSLRSLSSPTAAVVRDGVVIHVASITVVPGDIVDISVGDIVPADLRLVDSMNFEADEALLTGESLPVLKSHDVVFDDLDPSGHGIGVGDRINLAYSSSTVTKGRARGVVIATGMNTEIGRIAASLNGKQRKSGRSLNPVKYGPMQPIKGMSLRTWDAVGKFLGLTVGTPLQRKLAVLAYTLFVIACVLALIVFGVNEFNAQTEVTVYAISLGIAIIPESLLAVLTITMAAGMRRMANSRVMVRKLDALEALGGVTNICSDKTGTLTQGKMIAKSVWVPGAGSFSVIESTSPVDPTAGRVIAQERIASAEPNLDEKADISISSYETPTVTTTLASFLEASALCNLATVRFDSERKEWLATGDPTEIALQVFSHRFDYGKKALVSQGWTALAEYPFDSDVKRMSVVFEAPLANESRSRGDVVVFAKGAVERMLPLCTGYSQGSSYQKMTVELQESIMETVERFAKDGLRVLALAKRVEVNPKISYLDCARDTIERDFSFLGLAGIYDPPRVETKSAVEQCTGAGIRVHMLTGDHPATAAAIAREVGIIPKQQSDELRFADSQDLVMTATQFDKLSDDEVDQLTTLPRVIARCAPHTKVRMIEALHRRNKFCAMTGDGVNDSPSLRMADVGIAMGMGGSDVAKSASDLVLTDDNFASIVRAIEEGRRMFHNIQKFVLHLLAGNVGEVVLLIIGLAFKDDAGFSVFPLAPLQILWINMITSPGPAFGLSLEPANRLIMRRVPHDTKKGIFTWEIVVDTFVYGTIMGATCLATFIIVVYGHGKGDLGDECNKRLGDSCGVVFRARAAVFAQLTWLILVLALEIKDIRRSMFNLFDRSGSRMPVFRDLYSNKFLFYSVFIGFLSVFPAIHIPKLNTSVFKMKSITWEWSLPVAFLALFVGAVELWKCLKRREHWFETRSSFSLSNAVSVSASV
ncbi:uncharacterized protein V1516DRAFT_676306 [Lipomyces oligophaga]|uniref:uncharacterized protein n=1 Tax=Lipomyces oligophaga TaxID=45792 RepID=UPI0034CFAE06